MLWPSLLYSGYSPYCALRQLKNRNLGSDDGQRDSADLLASQMKIQVTAELRGISHFPAAGSVIA